MALTSKLAHGVQEHKKDENDSLNSVFSVK